MSGNVNYFFRITGFQMVEMTNHYIKFSFGVFLSSIVLLHQLSTKASVNQKKVFENVIKDFGLEKYKPVIDHYGR